MKNKNFKDLSGLRSGRLTAIRAVEKNKWGSYRWLCNCDCGNEKIIDSGSLIRNITKSCGCILKEMENPKKTHGLSKTKEYGIWAGIKKRCLNSKCKNWDRYGGRGIKVCERWLNSFENFIKDMGNRPSDKHTIERKNNNGDYEPNNCVWATRKQQGENKSNNRILEINGLSKTISQWSSISGINRATILFRIKSGWSPSKAVTQQISLMRR